MQLNTPMVTGIIGTFGLKHKRGNKMGEPYCSCVICRTKRNKKYAEEEKQRERTVQMLMERKTPPEDYMEDILP